MEKALRNVLITFMDPTVLANGTFQLNTNATIVVGQDVNLNQVNGDPVSLGQKPEDNSIPVVMASGTETPSASSVNSSGTVLSGAVRVAFTTNSSFAGTILGVARAASTTYTFQVTSPGKKLTSIAYTISAGSMIIDRID